MAKRTLNVVIAGDTKGLNRAFSSSSRDAKRWEDRIGRSSSAVGNSLKTGAKIGAAAVGVGLVGAIKGSIDAFAEAQRVAAQTNTVLKSTGGAAGVTAKQVEQLATAVSRKSGMDDEAIQSGQNLLLTFTKLRNEQGKGNDIFTQATSIMADMSTALGQDTKSSAIQLGKALNDPIRGVTALRRVGVSFTEEQQKQIKVLVDSGKTMDAQKLILKELRTEFGGSAEAAGNTFTGKINKAKVAVGNLGEAIGGALAPALGSAADKLAGFVDDLATSDRPAQFFKGIADFARQARDAIGGVGDKFKALKSTRGSAGSAIGVMVAEGFENINWTKIGQTMSKGISAAFNVGGQFSKGVQDGIGAALANVNGRELLSGLLRVVSEAIDALFSPSFWKENFANIFATVTIVIPVAKILKIPGANYLYQHISKPFIAALRRVGSTILRLLGRAATAGIGRFVDEIAGAFPGVVSVFVRLVARIGQAMSGLPGRLRRTGAAAMASLADSIGDRVGKIAADVVKFGVRIGKSLIDGIVKGVKSTVGKIGGAISGGIGAVGGFLGIKGEGIGKEIGTKFGSMPRGGSISGSLKGADAGMRPFAVVGSRFGLGVSSGLRGNAVTSSGNRSWHASGEALDLSGPAAGMMRTFQFLKSRMGGRLAELIYTPGGVGIKNGRPHQYTGSVAADHYDHVHVAMDLGKPGQGDGTGRRGRRPYTGDGIGTARSNARTVVGVGRRMGASQKEILAALMTILVEAGGKNLTYGDRDSEGLFQQRPSQGWGPASEGVAKDAAQFFAAARKANRRSGQSAGMLAQAVQRSAFPGRYDQRRGDALKLLGQVGGGSRRRTSSRGGGLDIGAAVGAAQEAARDRVAGRGTPIKGYEPANAFEMSSAMHDVAVSEAEASGNYLKVVSALTGQRNNIRARIGKIRGDLKSKRNMRPATRLRLTQELSGLISTEASISQRIGERPEVEAPDLPGPLDFLNRDISVAGLTAGTEDDIAAATALRDFRAQQYAFSRGGDPRAEGEFAEALKSAEDALKQLTDTTQEQTDAMKAHTEALDGVKAEIKRQTDFASAVQTTEAFQLKKMLADVLSGEIGARGVGRAFTPGAGREFAW